jgi:hypothetical protein
MALEMLCWPNETFKLLAFFVAVSVRLEYRDERRILVRNPLLKVLYDLVVLLLFLLATVHFGEVPFNLHINLGVFLLSCAHDHVLLASTRSFYDYAELAHLNLHSENPQALLELLVISVGGRLLRCQCIHF